MRYLTVGTKLTMASDTMNDMRLQSLFAVTMQVAIGVTTISAASAQQATRDLLAAQIRDQGYRCNKSVSAQRDLSSSKPDEAVWVLKCTTGTYRPRLIPDMAARVTRLD